MIIIAQILILRMILIAMKQLFCALFLFVMASPALAGEGYWTDLSGKIAFVLTDAEKIYAEGNAKRAKKAVQHAYFGIFESSKMEAAMRKTIGAKHTYLVEKKFGEMRKAIKREVSTEELHTIAEDLRKDLARDAAVLDKAGVSKDVFAVNQ